VKPTKEILEEAKELCDAATEGPWSVSANLPFYGIVEKPKPSLSKHDAEEPTFWAVDDAKFHTVSRTLMPRLIKALEVAIECIEQTDKCSCDEAYKSRDLLDLNCEYCTLSIESYQDEINQILNGKGASDD